MEHVAAAPGSGSKCPRDAHGGMIANEAVAAAVAVAVKEEVVNEEAANEEAVDVVVTDHDHHADRVADPPVAFPGTDAADPIPEIAINLYRQKKKNIKWHSLLCRNQLLY